MWLRPCHKISRDRIERVSHLVRLARESFRPDNWGCFPAHSAVVVPRGVPRKSGGDAPLFRAPSRTASQNNSAETVTANGCEGMPLATTKSEEEPRSRSLGISTFVVTIAAPVA